MRVDPDGIHATMSSHVADCACIRIPPSTTFGLRMDPNCSSFVLGRLCSLRGDTLLPPAAPTLSRIDGAPAAFAAYVTRPASISDFLEGVLRQVARPFPGGLYKAMTFLYPDRRAVLRTNKSSDLPHLLARFPRLCACLLLPRRSFSRQRT